MKFNNLYILFFLLALVSSKFTYLDFLKTDDTQIKNNYGKGNCVYLRGTNIGNLFVQEQQIPKIKKQQTKI